MFLRWWHKHHKFFKYFLQYYFGIMYLTKLRNTLNLGLSYSLFAVSIKGKKRKKKDFGDEIHKTG